MLFATLKDRAGTHQVTVELPDGASTADLVSALGAQHPALAPALASAVVAVNREFAFEDVTLRPADESLPAVSRRRLASAVTTRRSTTPWRAIAGPATGGVCVFAAWCAAAAPARAGSSGPRRATACALPRLHYEAWRDGREKLRQVAGITRAG
jgi:molybdopterin converting factor small subunit